jgi:regulation of enolase protein 1 (concanavalin A-like superfamily)
MDQDIGIANLWSGDSADLGWPGGASYAGGTYTVTGSGIDIWTNVDSFHFAFRAISGDCTNIVRVTSMGNTDPWAKAGVMVRESLNPDSVNAFMTMSSQNGALFSTRVSTGAASTSSGLGGISAPYWLKLVRHGSNFTGFSAPDGSNWTLVGTASVPMATNIFVGLAVTAHNNVLSNTATFTSVTIAGQLPAPPTSLTASLLNAEASLTWTGSPDAISYNVKRASSSNGVYSVIASNVVAATYMDSTVTPGASYFYEVSSVNVNGESANSSPASVLINLPTLGVVVSGTNIFLSWPTNTPGFSLYSTTNLNAPILWSPVAGTATPQGSNLVVELPIASDLNQFFKLSFAKP